MVVATAVVVATTVVVVVVVVGSRILGARPQRNHRLLNRRSRSGRNGRLELIKLCLVDSVGTTPLLGFILMNELAHRRCG
jgi:hypothetical protein